MRKATRAAKLTSESLGCRPIRVIARGSSLAHQMNRPYTQRDDSEWAAWSQGKLDSASATDTLAINPIIYSELSIAFARIEELEAVITEASLKVEPIPVGQSR